MAGLAWGVSEATDILFINQEGQKMSTNKDTNITVGSAVEIKAFTITDEKVVSAFKIENAEGRSVATFLENIIAVGTQVVGIANAGAGIEKLNDGISQTEKSITAASKRFTDDLAVKLEELTGEESVLAIKVTGIIEEFAAQIEGLTADENSPIREGIKKQMTDMATAIKDDFARQYGLQKEEIIRRLNPEAEGSPFAIFNRQITEMRAELTGITGTLAENKGKEIESKKGTDKGRTFEKAVMDVVAAIASGSGDDAEHTGDVPGLSGKMGDGVVTAKSGLKRVARIAVEAKDKRLTEAAWHKEAQGSMKNRDAVGFLGVCKHLEDMPNKQRLIALDDMGQQLVVCFNPDGSDSTELLALVYQVVKMHTLTANSSGDNVNVQAMSLFVQQSIKQLEKFNRMESLAKGIKKEADKIISESADIHDELTRHLRSMRRELSGVEPLLMIDDDAALALENSSESAED